jgi:hypothetical protein
MPAGFPRGGIGVSIFDEDVLKYSTSTAVHVPTGTFSTYVRSRPSIVGRNVRDCSALWAEQHR